MQADSCVSEHFCSPDVHKYFLNKPTYFGWGVQAMEKERLKEYAEQLFELSNHEVIPLENSDFSKNSFYHPGYLNRSFNRDHFQSYKKNVSERFYNMIHNSNKYSLNFAEIADNLNSILDKMVDVILNSEDIPVENIDNINGIYVFYENNKPIYVGRTNKKRMRSRIREHSMKSSNQNSATFAFRLAKEMKKDMNLKSIHPYDEDFLKAKERVQKMEVRIVEVDDPIIQTILEPYMAHKLGTLDTYNDFMTH